MKIPEKEFDEKYGYYDAPISLYQYLLMKASPFFWLHQNLHQSQAYFLKGYNLLKKSKGAEAPETENYKEQYVNFICWETATAHFEQTLWILIALIPLLMIMVPVFFRFALEVSWSGIYYSCCCSGMANHQYLLLFLYGQTSLRTGYSMIPNGKDKVENYGNY